MIVLIIADKMRFENHKYTKTCINKLYNATCFDNDSGCVGLILYEMHKRRYIFIKYTVIFISIHKDGSAEPIGR